MRSAAVSVRCEPASCAPRSIVAVSDVPQRAELLRTLLFDLDDCDVVVVESLARAYSRIKQVGPDLVVVLFEVDDVAACQLLSMLTIDAETAGIPVMTLATASNAFVCDAILTEVIQDSSLSEGLWT
jgi:CheY-like chemotaxis protein